MVLGIASSVAETVTASVGRGLQGFIGLTITTTLLNWDGRIVYDGLALGAPLNAKSFAPTKRSKIISAYIKAMDTNSLIKTLPLIEPENFKLKQSTVSSKVEMDDLKYSLRKELAFIKALKYSGNADELSKINKQWIFRRHGYTEETNSEHLLTILGASEPGLPIVFRFRCAAYTVSAAEIVCAMADGCRRKNFKPRLIAVDQIEVIPDVTALLQDVEVIYYPPPSEEEQKLHDTAILLCNFCTADKAQNGGKLAACSACKIAFYCCKEHQKLDWKFHKLSCNK